MFQRHVATFRGNAAICRDMSRVMSRHVVCIEKKTKEISGKGAAKLVIPVAEITVEVI